MKIPYTITELDALMHACVSFTEQHEPNFYTGNIAGRDGVSTDIDSVKRMMDWIAETDKGLLESLGFGKDNVVYFRLGRDAQRIMNNGGFKKYFRNRTMKERLERVRIWAPIGISLLAAIVSILVWQAPKGSSSRIDDLTTQLNGLRSDQEQTKSMITAIRGDTHEGSFPPLPTTTPTNGGLTIDVSPSPLPTKTSTTGDTNGGFVPAPASPAPIDQLPGLPDKPWLLLAAVAMFGISFFLLHQAGRFHLWVAIKDKATPTPLFGIVFACLVSLTMVLLSIYYLIVRYPPPVNDRRDFGAVVHWLFLHHPSELAAGVLLGSIVPSAIAIYTFAMAGFIMRDRGQESPPLTRSPTAALAGAIFSLIAFAGSIATLIMFFSWIKNP
jgi:hypothetical protein